jgi:hypothetical protein
MRGWDNEKLWMMAVDLLNFPFSLARVLHMLLHQCPSADFGAEKDQSIKLLLDAVLVWATEMS